MFEIDYKFNPGETVFCAIRDKSRVLKGVVMNVTFTTYMRNKELMTDIVYYVDTSFDNQHHGLTLGEDSLFDNAEDAIAYLSPTQ